MRETITTQRDENRHSWLSLVLLCLVTALSAALGFGVLFAGASVAYAVVESSPLSNSAASAAEAVQPGLSVNQVSGAPIPGNQVAAEGAARSADDSIHAEPSTRENNETSGIVFTGMITESRCGARHSRNSGKSSAECVRSCVRHGAHYVLVDGENVYALDGDPAQLDQAASVRVEVVGMRQGDTIRVKSVAMR